MKKLYFVRHGQTEWNAIRRMQGQLNSDLSDLGRDHARNHGELLASVGIDAIFASPLDRTRQTAAIINQHLELPIIYDDRIKEWDCGDWSGHLYEEVMERWPNEWEALQADRFHYRGPNCENYPDMIERARPFINEIMAHPAEQIAVVSHGMIGTVMVAIVLGLDEDETLSIYQPNDVVLMTETADRNSAPYHYVSGAGPTPGLHTRETAAQAQGV